MYSTCNPGAAFEFINYRLQNHFASYTYSNFQLIVYNHPNQFFIPCKFIVPYNQLHDWLTLFNVLLISLTALHYF